MTLPAGAARMNPRSPLMDYYRTLLRSFGPQGWWPARTRIEVIVGAILTQNASWRNAALALAQLRKAGLLKLERLKAADSKQLETLIRSAGFYRQKAATIRRVLAYLELAHGGSLRRMFSQEAGELRRGLLGVKGLGPESVDAILLYAGELPFFVADAYTRRILARHGWLSAVANYEDAQELLHRELPRDAAVFNEFHALLVETGKRYCFRRAPRCQDCPLRHDLPEACA